MVGIGVGDCRSGTGQVWVERNPSAVEINMSVLYLERPGDRRVSLIHITTVKKQSQPLIEGNTRTPIGIIYFT